jgi:hypothetical protein
MPKTLQQPNRTGFVKPPVNKADLRRELDRQMRAYLREGGEVHEIPRGVSGRNPADGPLPPTPLIDGTGREDRTYLVEVIAAIEARRKPAPTASKTTRRPRKKLIYDDFGEPLRWMWEE